MDNRLKEENKIKKCHPERMKAQDKLREGSQMLFLRFFGLCHQNDIICILKSMVYRLWSKVFFLRLTSLVTLLMFTTTTLAWSAPDLIYKIKVPQEYGRVKERWMGNRESVIGNRLSNTDQRTPINDQPLIIHIQDAHTSLEAQENIAKLIQTLVKQYNITLVAVEGADGPIDMAPYRSYPDQQVKDIVATRLIKRGLFTGSTKAALLTDKPIDYTGVEEEKLYVQNYQALKNTLPLREAVLRNIHDWKAQLKQMKVEAYRDTPLQILDQLRENFDQDQISFLDYYVQLREQAIKNLDLADFSEFFNFGEKLEKSSQHTDQEISEALSSVDLTRLMEQCLKVQYELEKKLATRDSSLVSRLSSDASRDTLHALQLIEINHLFLLIEKLVSLKAIEYEVEDYKNHKTETLQALQKTLFEFSSSQEDFKTCLEALKEAENFYQLAEQRNRALIDNTLAQLEQRRSSFVKREAQEKNTSRDTLHTSPFVNAAILVAGGYHSEGLTAELRKRNIPYLTITPHLTQIKEDLPYWGILSGHYNPLVIGNGQNTLAVANALDSLFGKTTGQDFQAQFENHVSNSLKMETPQHIIIASLITEGLLTALSHGESTETFLDNLVNVQHFRPAEGLLKHKKVLGSKIRNIALPLIKRSGQVTPEELDQFSTAAVRSVLEDLFEGETVSSESIPNAEALHEAAQYYLDYLNGQNVILNERVPNKLIEPEDEIEDPGNVSLVSPRPPAPLGMMGIWGRLLDRGWAPWKVAALAGFVEELIFSGAAFRWVEPFFAHHGMPLFRFWLGLNLLFAVIFHHTVFVWNGKGSKARLTRRPAHLSEIFTILAAASIFRLGYMAGWSEEASLAFAILAHVFYNDEISRWWRLPLAMATHPAPKPVVSDLGPEITMDALQREVKLKGEIEEDGFWHYSVVYNDGQIGKMVVGERDRHVVIRDLSLDTNYRNRGIARVLIQYMVTLAWQKGYQIGYDGPPSQPMLQILRRHLRDTRIHLTDQGWQSANAIDEGPERVIRWRSQTNENHEIILEGEVDSHTLPLAVDDSWIDLATRYDFESAELRRRFAHEVQTQRLQIWAEHPEQSTSAKSMAETALLDVVVKIAVTRALEKYPQAAGHFAVALTGSAGSYNMMSSSDLDTLYFIDVPQKTSSFKLKDVDTAKDSADQFLSRLYGSNLTSAKRSITPLLSKALDTLGEGKPYSSILLAEELSKLGLDERNRRPVVEWYRAIIAEQGGLGSQVQEVIEEINADLNELSGHTGDPRVQNIAAPIYVPDSQWGQLLPDDQKQIKEKRVSEEYSRFVDMRFVVGNRDLFEQRREQWEAIVHNPSKRLRVMELKAIEFDERYVKPDPRTGLEGMWKLYSPNPDVKEIFGGLRSYDYMRWFARFQGIYGPVVEGLTKGDPERNIPPLLIGDEPDRVREAIAFLRFVRRSIAQAGVTHTTILTDELQRKIANLHPRYQNLATEEERVAAFMADYYRYAQWMFEANYKVIRRSIQAQQQVGDTPIDASTRRLKAIADRQGWTGKEALPAELAVCRHESWYFSLENGFRDNPHPEISLQGKEELLKDRPDLYMKLFRLTLETDSDQPLEYLRLSAPLLDAMQLHVGSFRQAMTDRAFAEKTRKEFMEILSSSKDVTYVVRRMNVVGILGDIIPGFEDVQYQPIFDPYKTRRATLGAQALASLRRFERLRCLPTGSKEFNDEEQEAHNVAGGVLNRLSTESRAELRLAILLSPATENNHSLAQGDRELERYENQKTLEPFVSPRVENDRWDRVLWLLENYRSLLAWSREYTRADFDATRHFIQDVVHGDPIRAKLLLAAVVADDQKGVHYSFPLYQELSDLYDLSDEVLSDSDLWDTYIHGEWKDGRKVSPGKKDFLQEQIRKADPSISSVVVRSYLNAISPSYLSRPLKSNVSNVQCLQRLYNEEKMSVEGSSAEILLPVAVTAYQKDPKDPYVELIMFVKGDRPGQQAAVLTCLYNQRFEVAKAQAGEKIELRTAEGMIEPIYLKRLTVKLPEGMNSLSEEWLGGFERELAPYLIDPKSLEPAIYDEVAKDIHAILPNHIDQKSTYALEDWEVPNVQMRWNYLKEEEKTELLVSAKDFRGFLLIASQVFSEYGVNIHRAQIYTRKDLKHGDVVDDRFVLTRNGRALYKIERDAIETDLRKLLSQRVIDLSAFRRSEIDFSPFIHPEPLQGGGAIIIPDLDGNFDALVTILKRNGMIVNDPDSEFGYKWNPEMMHRTVVQMGDSIGRSKDSLKTYRFLRELQKQAKTVGVNSQVIRLIGNHELKIMLGNPEPIDQRTIPEQIEPLKEMILEDVMNGSMQATFYGYESIFVHAGINEFCEGILFEKIKTWMQGKGEFTGGASITNSKIVEYLNEQLVGWATDISRMSMDYDDNEMKGIFLDDYGILYCRSKRPYLNRQQVTAHHYISDHFKGSAPRPRFVPNFVENTGENVVRNVVMTDVNINGGNLGFLQIVGVGQLISCRIDNMTGVLEKAPLIFGQPLQVYLPYALSWEVSASGSHAPKGVSILSRWILKKLGAEKMSPHTVRLLENYLVPWFEEAIFYLLPRVAVYCGWVGATLYAALAISRAIFVALHLFNEAPYAWKREPFKRFFYHVIVPSIVSLFSLVVPALAVHSVSFLHLDFTPEQMISLEFVISSLFHSFANRFVDFLKHHTGIVVGKASLVTTSDTQLNPQIFNELHERNWLWRWIEHKGKQDEAKSMIASNIQRLGSSLQEVERLFPNAETVAVSGSQVFGQALGLAEDVSIPSDHLYIWVIVPGNQPLDHTSSLIGPDLELIVIGHDQLDRDLRNNESKVWQFMVGLCGAVRVKGSNPFEYFPTPTFRAFQDYQHELARTDTLYQLAATDAMKYFLNEDPIWPQLSSVEARQVELQARAARIEREIRNRYAWYHRTTPSEIPLVYTVVLDQSSLENASAHTRARLVVIAPSLSTSDKDKLLGGLENLWLNRDRVTVDFETTAPDEIRMQQEEALQRWIAVQHDLKNPFGTVHLALDVAVTQHLISAEDGARYKERLRSLKESGQVLTRDIEANGTNSEHMLQLWIRLENEIASIRAFWNSILTEQQVRIKIEQLLQDHEDEKYETLHDILFASEVSARLLNQVQKRPLAEVADIQAPLQTALRHSRLSKSVRVEPQLPYVWASHLELERVFTNVLKNADEAQATDVQIIIRKARLDPSDRQSRQGIEVILHDNGSGFPPDSDLLDEVDGSQRLFMTRSSRRKVGGSGRGLTSSFRFARHYGGVLQAGRSVDASGAVSPRAVEGQTGAVMRVWLPTLDVFPLRARNAGETIESYLRSESIDKPFLARDLAKKFGINDPEVAESELKRLEAQGLVYAYPMNVDGHTTLEAYVAARVAPAQAPFVRRIAQAYRKHHPELEENEFHHYRRLFEQLIQASSAIYGTSRFTRGSDTYLNHCLDVAAQAAEWGAGEVEIVAALLHAMTPDQRQAIYANRSLPAHLDGTLEQARILLRHWDHIKRWSRRLKDQYELDMKFDRNIQNFMNMMIQLLGDEQPHRVLRLVLADQLFTITTADPENESEKKALEDLALQVYAPLAERMGRDEWATELRDQILLLTNPQAHQESRKAFQRLMGGLSYEDADAHLEALQRGLERKLAEKGIQAKVSARKKGLWSIQQKVQHAIEEGKEVEEISDLLGIAVVLPTHDRMGEVSGVMANLLDEQNHDPIVDDREGKIGPQHRSTRPDLSAADRSERKPPYVSEWYKFHYLTQVNVEGSQRGALELQVYDQENYSKYRHHVSRAHWIYKIDLFLQRHGVVQRFQADPLESSSEAENPDSEISFERQVRFLRKSLSKRVYVGVELTRPKGAAGKTPMVIVDVSRFSVPSDAAAHAAVNVLKSDYGYMCELPSGRPLDFDQKLTTGQFLKFQAGRGERLKEIEREADRPRTVLQTELSQMPPTETRGWEGEGRKIFFKGILKMKKGRREQVEMQFLNQQELDEFGFKNSKEFFQWLYLLRKTERSRQWNQRSFGKWNERAQALMDRPSYGLTVAVVPLTARSYEMRFDIPVDRPGIEADLRRILGSYGITVVSAEVQDREEKDAADHTHIARRITCEVEVARGVQATEVIDQAKKEILTLRYPTRETEEMRPLTGHLSFSLSQKNADQNIENLKQWITEKLGNMEVNITDTISGEPQKSRGRLEITMRVPISAPLALSSERIEQALGEYISSQIESAKLENKIQIRDIRFETPSEAQGSSAAFKPPLILKSSRERVNYFFKNNRFGKWIANRLGWQEVPELAIAWGAALLEIPHTINPWFVSNHIRENPQFSSGEKWSLVKGTALILLTTAYEIKTVLSAFHPILENHPFWSFASIGTILLGVILIAVVNFLTHGLWDTLAVGYPSLGWKPLIEGESIARLQAKAREILGRELTSDQARQILDRKKLDEIWLNGFLSRAGFRLQKGQTGQVLAAVREIKGVPKPSASPAPAATPSRTIHQKSPQESARELYESWSPEDRILMCQIGYIANPEIMTVLHMEDIPNPEDRVFELLGPYDDDLESKWERVNSQFIDKIEADYPQSGLPQRQFGQAFHNELVKLMQKEFIYDWTEWVIIVMRNTSQLIPFLNPNTTEHQALGTFAERLSQTQLHTLGVRNPQMRIFLTNQRMDLFRDSEVLAALGGRYQPPRANSFAQETATIQAVDKLLSQWDEPTRRFAFLVYVVTDMIPRRHPTLFGHLSKDALLQRCFVQGHTDRQQKLDQYNRNLEAFLKAEHIRGDERKKFMARLLRLLVDEFLYDWSMEFSEKTTLDQIAAASRADAAVAREPFDMDQVAQLVFEPGHSYDLGTFQQLVELRQLIGSHPQAKALIRSIVSDTEKKLKEDRVISLETLDCLAALRYLTLSFLRKCYLEEEGKERQESELAPNIDHSMMRLAIRIKRDLSVPIKNLGLNSRWLSDLLASATEEPVKLRPQLVSILERQTELRLDVQEAADQLEWLFMDEIQRAQPQFEDPVSGAVPSGSSRMHSFFFKKSFRGWLGRLFGPMSPVVIHEFGHWAASILTGIVPRVVIESTPSTYKNKKDVLSERWEAYVEHESFRYQAEWTRLHYLRDLWISLVGSLVNLAVAGFVGWTTWRGVSMLSSSDFVFAYLLSFPLVIWIGYGLLHAAVGLSNLIPYRSPIEVRYDGHDIRNELHVTDGYRILYDLRHIFGFNNLIFNFFSSFFVGITYLPLYVYSMNLTINPILFYTAFTSWIIFGSVNFILLIFRSNRYLFKSKLHTPEGKRIYKTANSVATQSIEVPITVFVEESVALGGMNPQVAMDKKILTSEQIEDQKNKYEINLQRAMGNIKVVYYAKKDLFDKVKDVKGHYFILENESTAQRAQEVLTLKPRADVIFVPSIVEMQNGNWLVPPSAFALGQMLLTSHRLVASHVQAPAGMKDSLAQLYNSDAFQEAA